MLNQIISSSVRNPLVVLGLTGAFILLGLMSLPGLAIDAFPDTTPVQIQINTNAPGMAPLDVEQLFTIPLEQSISGLPHLQDYRSISKFSLSQITVTFDDEMNIYLARQLISEKIGGVDLPSFGGKPTLGPIATGLGEVFHYALSSRTRNPIELRTFQDWIIRPALRQVQGTAEINSWGGRQKQYQIRLDPQLMLKYDITFDQVMQAIAANNLNVGGNVLQQSGQAYLIQGLGLIHNLDQIRNIVITNPRKGLSVRVADLARVEVGSAIPIGGVTTGGQGECVLGLGFMLMGENSKEVTNQLKLKLNDVKTRLPEDVKVEVLYDRTELVDHVIDTVRRNLFEGGLLVIAILFLFLGNLRAGLIVASAIPLAMLFAFSGMLRYGIAGSLLSLGAIDFGLVVDSSVVMIENCVRHLSHGDQEGKPHHEVIEQAALEVRKPTMFGELIIMIVYLPILTLEGVAGKMFRPMALTVIFALIGSLILSLTLMPVLASLLLPRKMKEEEPMLIRLAGWIYRPVLQFAMCHTPVVLAGLAGTSLIVGLLAWARKDKAEFIPRLSEGAMVLNIVRLAGIDIHETMRLNTRMEQMLLREFPREIAHVWARTGTAEVATDPMGPEETDFFIALKPRSQWREEIENQDQLRERIDQMFDDIPGQTIDYTQPIEQRINEMVSGVKTDIAVKIFGNDFDILREKGEQIVKILESIPGCKNPKMEQTTGQPMLRIQVNQEQLARYGLSARAVLDLVEALGSKPAGDVVEKPLRFPLVVRVPERLRQSPDTVRNMTLLLPTGERIPLSRVAQIETIEGPSKISREKGQRRVVVTCNVDGTDVGTFVQQAQREVKARVTLPKGNYSLEWGGQFENLVKANRTLRIVVPVALILIFGLLYLSYHDLRDVILVFSAVPFGAAGGVLALWLRNIDFSISAAVGFIALAGVSVLNSMVLVTFIRHLFNQGLPLNQAIEEAAITRLRPVLMTALVASFGFVPMALSTGVGAEVQRPLATVVIGGVISSTLLTLLVLPILYNLFGPRHQSGEIPLPATAHP